MSANTQFVLDALQQAEYVLDVAERDLRARTTWPQISESGDEFHMAGSIDVASLDWSGFSSATITKGSTTGQYVYEYAGKIPDETSSVSEDVKDGEYGKKQFFHLFIVTARAVSGRGATRIVQSVVKSPGGP